MQDVGPCEPPTTTVAERLVGNLVAVLKSHGVIDVPEPFWHGFPHMDIYLISTSPSSPTRATNQREKLDVLDFSLRWRLGDRAVCPGPARRHRQQGRVHVA
ncbi:hypothetical protein BJV74DRAFT_859123 [Russula compacta]|nr:hypothetical protein BJV74DRAFT_859123 [Russula compacta]